LRPESAFSVSDSPARTNSKPEACYARNLIILTDYRRLRIDIYSID
jgi:hypothetical protein